MRGRRFGCFGAPFWLTHPSLHLHGRWLGGLRVFRLLLVEDALRVGLRRVPCLVELPSGGVGCRALVWLGYVGLADAGPPWNVGLVSIGPP